MNEHQALLKAVEVLGGQAGMASELSARMGIYIRQGHVYNWIHRGKRLPEKYARYVEAATKDRGCTVYAYQLCPIAFGKIA